MKCANCGTRLNPGDTTGNSSLFNHGDGIKITLCEPCFLAEEELIDEAGTNDMVARRNRYLANMGLKPMGGGRD